MTPAGNTPRINIVLRWAVGLIGVALVASSVVLIYRPPTPSTIERNEKDEQVKRTSAPTDLSTLFVTVFVSGVGLLLFAVNGYRFTRFSAAGVSVDSEAVAQEAKKQLSQPADEMEEINIDKSAEPDPKPTQSPASTIAAEEGEYALYALTDVPTQVIQDALSEWPTTYQKPTSLADFEFASRKKGKGNHAWQLKFRGRPLVVVTYGGQAKGDATVKSV